MDSVLDIDFAPLQELSFESDLDSLLLPDIELSAIDILLKDNFTNRVGLDADVILVLVFVLLILVITLISNYWVLYHTYDILVL